VFKVDRGPNPQLAMGHGAHVCLGQHLAKMELRSFFREFVARLDGVELAGAAIMAPGVTTNQMQALPIRCALRATSKVGELA
jgi:cytochrome P450